MGRGAAAVVLAAFALAGCGGGEGSFQAASVPERLPETATSIPTLLPVKAEHHGMMMPSSCPLAGQSVAQLTPR
jgi:hypothetical protein